MKTLLIIPIFIIFCSLKGQNLTAINSNNIFEYINQSNSLTETYGSTTIVHQEGFSNMVELYLINDSVVTQQIGDNNTMYYKDNSKMAAGITVNMIGNNNIVEVLGSNAISDGMKIDIIGSHKTIQIENH